MIYKPKLDHKVIIVKKYKQIIGSSWLTITNKNLHKSTLWNNKKTSI